MGSETRVQTGIKASARARAAAGSRVTWLALLAVVALLATAAPAGAASRPCLVPGVGKPLDRVWRPDMRAAIAYQRPRQGDIAFAVRTDGAFYGYRPDHQEWSASVVKAMLMVAYLDRPTVAHRDLDGNDRSLLIPMITRSDNNAADVVDTIVGAPGLTVLARRVGMTRFLAVEPIWGETHITPRDQTRFFLHIERYIAPRHRAFALRLLAGVIPAQRWGIGAVAPHGWKLYFKGGWGSGTGLTRGCARVSIAVLSMHDGSHAYGKATLRGLFARLLRGSLRGPTLATADPVGPVLDRRGAALPTPCGTAPASSTRSSRLSSQAGFTEAWRKLT
jgi:Beta-lactamase enzyme family